VSTPEFIDQIEELILQEADRISAKSIAEQLDT
jgi:hypothetical protein